MTFSLFSVVLILFIGTSLTVEIVRGIKRGFARACVGLASVVLGVLLALIPAVWLSNLLVDWQIDTVYDFLCTNMAGFAEYDELLPNLDKVVWSVADMLITPVLFLVFFLILRLVLRILISMILHRCWGTFPTDPRPMGASATPKSITTPNYEGKALTFFRRHDRLLGGVAGGLTGFLVTLAVLAPLLGTLSITNTVLDSMTGESGKTTPTVAMSPELDDVVSPFLDDAVVRIFSSAGGNLMYDAMTVSSLNDEIVVLRAEVNACMDIYADLQNVVKALSEGGAADDEAQRDSIRVFGEDIGESEIMCTVTTDFIKGATDQWLKGETYMEVARPSCGSFVDPIMDQVFYFLYTEAEPRYISMDIKTMFNVYLIAIENGLLQDGGTGDLLTQLDSGDVLEDIYAELALNPRMTGLVDYLTGQTMKVMAQAIDLANLSEEDYNALMASLSEAVSLVNSMDSLDFAEQVNMMTDHALHYSDQYGFELPESVAQMAVTSMMDQFADAEEVTAEDMRAYMKYLLTDGTVEAPDDAGADDLQPIP